MNSGHIHQDNVWAMTLPHDIFDRLLTDYKLAVAEIELSHRTIRNRDKDRMSDYFNSTNNRLGFYYLMAKAAYVKQPYNVSQISKALAISRQSATTLVQECLAEGWIETPPRWEKHYQASKIMIDADSQYALKRLERLRKIGYQKAAQPLQEYMKLCQTV
mgnify:CR=1 FL=1